MESTITMIKGLRGFLGASYLMDGTNSPALESKLMLVTLILRLLNYTEEGKPFGL